VLSFIAYGKSLSRPFLFSLVPVSLLLFHQQEAGEEFFANRALMELVQRIRADNNLFAK